MAAFRQLTPFWGWFFCCCVGGVLRIGDADVALRVGDGILQFVASPAGDDFCFLYQNKEETE